MTKNTETKKKAVKFDKLLGAKIYELRHQNGLPREKLAKVLEVTHQQLQKYETGVNRFPVAKILTLASFFNKPVDYFFIGGERLQDPNFDIEHTLEMEFMGACSTMINHSMRSLVKIKNAKVRSALIELIHAIAECENMEFAPRSWIGR